MRELALHILDVLQNAAEAGATQVSLVVDEDLLADRLRITVADDGRGLAPEALARVADPFFTTRQTRHVGLGLPLFAAAAERAGGRLAVHSQPGQGTVVDATFQASHADRQPLGAMADTLLAFLLTGSAPELRYRHRVRWADEPDGNWEFAFDTAEVRAVLGDVPLAHPLVRQWLAEFLIEGENRECQR